MYFFRKKYQKLSDGCFACSWRPNAGNGRLIAGLQANLPRFSRFSPPSADGSGIKSGFLLSCFSVFAAQREFRTAGFSAFRLQRIKSGCGAERPERACEKRSLSCPFSEAPQLLPRKRHADGLGTFCHQKVRICLLRKDKSMLRKSGNIRRACPAGGLKPFFGGGWDRKNYSEIIPEPTSSSPSYHAANCPGVMPRWGVSKRM